MIYLSYFFTHGFKLPDSVYNGCHDVTVLSVNISDIAIITVTNVSYVVLFITFANLKQLIYEKSRGIIKKMLF